MFSQRHASEVHILSQSSNISRAVPVSLTITLANLFGASFLVLIHVMQRELVFARSGSVISKTAIFPKKQGRKREISNESARGSSLRKANV